MKSPEKVVDYIVQWLISYSNKSATSGFVIGISGGIDSALTSTLCARTNKPVLCLEMPIHQKENEVARAQKHIAWLESNYSNVQHYSISLTETFNYFQKSLPSTDSTESENVLLSLANSRARLRMTTLYYFASIKNYLVVGTGNKVEDFGIGFYTKYGDGGVDISPIADLMKSEVFLLAKTLEIIDDIQNATPTDGLWDDERTDEHQIGGTYDELEWAMQNIKTPKQKLSERQKEVLQIYTRLHNKSKHKMTPIPVCNIPKNI